MKDAKNITRSNSKILTQILFSSFPVAIKTSLNSSEGLTDLLQEEARTMLKIDSYHEHIVNLQGITYTWDLEKQNISEVTKIFIIKSVSVDNINSLF